MGEDAERDQDVTMNSNYAIELNEHLKTFDCPDCGEKSVTVWGWVSKDGRGVNAAGRKGIQ